MKKICYLFLFLCIGVSLQAQRLINTDYVVNVLKSRKNDLISVCAHRGYWRENGVPENSLKAIQRAADNQIEMVELDIKLSSDQQPVLMHDWNLGRTTELGMGRNELVNKWPNGALQSLRLKDKNGNLTNEHLPTFRQALSYIRDHKIAIVVVLDIKDALTARICWEIMNEGGGWANAWGTPARRWVIFKINAPVFPTTDNLEHTLDPVHSTRDLLYVPVYTTNMVDKINCIDHYKHFRRTKYFVSAEVDIKQRGGIQEDVMTQAWVDNHATCCFNAIPDAGGNRFYKANGECCYTLSELYYTAKSGQRDTDDRRGSWQFLTDIGIRWITTDEPINLINDYLSQRNIGFRNTSYYYSNGGRVAADSPQEDSLDNSQDKIVLSNIGTTESNSGISIYPNPASDFVNVKFVSSTTGKFQFEIFDLNGKPVLIQQQMVMKGSQDVRIPVKPAITTPGIYIMTITSADQSMRRSFKISIVK